MSPLMEMAKGKGLRFFMVGENFLSYQDRKASHSYQSDWVQNLW